jgi:PAS domain S-box-containing protein
MRGWSSTNAALVPRQSLLYPPDMEQGLPAPDDPYGLGPPEHLFRGLVEQIPAIVYIVSNDRLCETLYVSPQCTDMIGYTPQEWTADVTLWPNTLHPADRLRVTAEWADSVRTGTTFRAEYRFLRRNGDVMWVSDESRLILDEMGRPRFWQGVIMDITARRRAQEVARASEARYQALVEGIPAVVYEMGPDDERRTRYVSPHVEEVLGYTRTEWLDQPDIWMELLHPDDREVQLAANDQHNESGDPWMREYRLIASDGRVVWVRDLATLVRDDEGQPRIWQGVMLDITAQKEAEETLRFANDDLEFRVLARTSELAEANEMMTLEIGERKRVEEQLRQAEERYRILVERLPAVVYIWDVTERDGRSEHYTSPMIEDLTGFTRAEWVSRPDVWVQRIHPHDRQRVMAQVLACEASGEPFDDEYRLLAKDGHIVWVHDRANLLTRDHEGRPHLFQGFLVDISERKEAERKAQTAEERYRFVAEDGPVMAYDVLMEHDDDGTSVDVQYLSPGLQRLLGLDVDEWRRHPERWAEAVHPDDRERVRASFRESVEADRDWSETYRFLTEDGRIVWLRSEGRAVERDDLGRPTRFRGVLLDVTDHMTSENELREAEERYRTIVEAIPGVPWTECVDLVSGDTRMDYIGPQVERLFGWTAEELLAEPGHFDRMLHPDDRDRVQSYTERVERSGGPKWQVRFRCVVRDGSVRTFQSHATPRRDDQGRIVAWYGITFLVDDMVDATTIDLSASADPAVDLTP